MPDLNHANHVGIDFTEVGGELRATVVGQEPAHSIVEVATSLTLTAAHNGATVELADNAAVTPADSLPAGWHVNIVRTGATAGTINRGTGHTLNGPGGDQASYTIDGLGDSAYLYAKGSNVFRVIGPVT